jgi:hypothetical protein
MTDATVEVSGAEARQSMVRVWMAISAVWVTFWLSIAALFLAAFETRGWFQGGVAPYALIILLPPLILLALGALGRLLYEASTRRRPTRLH